MSTIGTIIHGFLVSGSLIVAIGAQNAFVLKQGLLQHHIFWVCLTCFVCDFLLMSLGVLGFGTLINQHPVATIALAVGGAVFLFAYGLTAFKSAYQGTSALALDSTHPSESLQKTLVATLALTLLNPHVYIDTVMLIGSISSTLGTDDKYMFLIGALSASAIWFFGLGYGAKFLIPLFNKPHTWRILDGCIGVIMWLIGIGLLNFVYKLTYHQT